MKTVVAIVLASVAITAGARTVEGNKIILDPDEQAKCEEVGCMVIPIDRFMERLEKAFEMGKAEAREQIKSDWVTACGGRT